MCELERVEVSGNCCHDDRVRQFGSRTIDDEALYGAGCEQRADRCEFDCCGCPGRLDGRFWICVRHPRCGRPQHTQMPWRRTGTSAGFEFDGPTGAYVVTLYLLIGETTFPATTQQPFVSLVNLRDASKHWTIGGRTQSPTTTGIASFDGTRGTVDVDMIPDPPNPALTPIHLKGSFTC